MFWFLVFSPLAGFLINALRLKSPQRYVSGVIATLSCLISFSAGAFYLVTYKGVVQNFFLFPWISLESFNINFSFVLDPLSLIMILLITGVGSLIHIYSIAYMKKEEGITRYFAYLNLFVFNMLLLVLADNLLLMFIGWEGVGLCSYLLIGFWFEDLKKVKAGMRAFVVNRIGDTGFLLGMFILFSCFNSLQFDVLNATSLKNQTIDSNLLTLATFFLFLGAIGKSAQGPLYFWLPKAMAGPTPVSALIHAATMVTAGIYMIARLFPLFQSTPLVLSFIAWVGGITALFSALVATKQWDFKRVLAFSTCSQLAYMFMALGVKAVPESIFHLFTHGFFKALLFLCAGSVIHNLGGEQDIRLMGGLKKYLPKTFWPYLIGAFCLIALPPFSGFFSKDGILFSLFVTGHFGLWGIAFLTALLTTFYMTRLTCFVFLGGENFKKKPHKEESLLWIPLVILAFLSFIVGGLGIPHVLSQFFPNHPPHFMNLWLKDFSILPLSDHYALEIKLMLLSAGASLSVLCGTGFYYLKIKKQKGTSLIATLFEQEFYVESFLKRVFISPFQRLAQILFKNIDESFLQGSILFLVKNTAEIKKRVASWQNGDLQSYAFYFITGLTILMVLMFTR